MAKLDLTQEMVHVFPPFDDKMIHLLFPNLKFQPDDDLETWLTYLARELSVAKLNKEKHEAQRLEAWLNIVQREKSRRVDLAEFGAPSYDGHNRFDKRLIDDIKSYYSGNNFLALFYDITGITPKKMGRNWHYLCPLHQDTHPSGVIYPEGKWFCFGCRAGGDVFTLLELFPPHLTFSQAVKKLAADARITIQLTEGTAERLRERLQRHAK